MSGELGVGFAVVGVVVPGEVLIALTQAVTDEEFVERVAGAQEPFWRAVSDALGDLSRLEPDWMS